MENESQKSRREIVGAEEATQKGIIRFPFIEFNNNFSFGERFPSTRRGRYIRSAIGRGLYFRP